MNHDETEFYKDLDSVDAQIERFTTPDERRRKFLSEQVAGSGPGRANVEKLSGDKLKKAAMMAGALQTGRAPSLVREGVEKRMAGG